MNTAFALFRMKNQIGSLIAPNHTAVRMGKLFLSPRRYSPKAWESAAESTAERFWLTPELSALRWSPTVFQRDSKIALLVHGWESRATQMAPLVPDLQALGYQVIALDMPAHGHSSGSTTNVYAFAQTLLQAQRLLGPFDTVIGHSMGAAASGVAHSLGLQMSKLILISGPSSIESVLNRFAGFIGLGRRARKHFLDVIGETVGVPPKALDVATGLQASNASILVIHDEDDLEVPLSESRRLAQALPHARLVVTQGLGHRKILRSDLVRDEILNHLS